MKVARLVGVGAVKGPMGEGACPNIIFIVILLFCSDWAIRAHNITLSYVSQGVSTVEWLKGGEGQRTCRANQQNNKPPRSHFSLTLACACGEEVIP